MLRLQTSIKAAGISKPAVESFVDAFRSHGQYCPLNDRLYMVLSPSTLARHGSKATQSGSSLVLSAAAAAVAVNHIGESLKSPSDTPSEDKIILSNGAGSHSKSSRGQPQDMPPANSLPVYLAASGRASHVGAAEGCLWRQTTAVVKKGAEILQGLGGPKQRCTWPGF
jgi:hypothetical protein